MSVILLYLGYAEFRKTAKFMLKGSLVFCLCLAAAFQVIYMNSQAAGYQRKAHFYQAGRWIASQTEKESVIVTSYVSPETFVMYAKRFVFVPYLHYSLITLDEFCERYLLLQGLFGDDLTRFFTTLDLPTKKNLAWLTYRSPESLKKAFARFEAFQNHDQGWYLQHMLMKYKVDYILLTPEDASRSPQTLAFFEKHPLLENVFQHEQTRIYRIKHN